MHDTYKCGLSNTDDRLCQPDVTEFSALNGDLILLLWPSEEVYRVIEDLNMVKAIVETFPKLK